ncbi:Coiled-coil domain-containing protein 89 [Channa argus]|uniref:Coiled-coil domain-containing protein 89 n=1 Tax=Channa argus TaxID=215402 RepID=A0A6G1PXL8_CHAAH|nr:Coiled-coil domain-containing protein 89 [Channa argus]KAK2906106.1 hypothetical protein Q8A73_010049 [Channa argus]
MAAPQKKAEHFMKVKDSSVEHMNSIQSSIEKLLSFSKEDTTELEMLQSRINEQSSLIGILKQRSDELLQRYQALQTIHSELEDKETDYQEKLDAERQKVQLLEKRFMDLAAYNEGIIAFRNEYKNQNAQLKLENKKLQEENDTLFCQKLQDKEVMLQKLMQEVKHLTEKNTKKEKEYRLKLADYQTKLLEQTTQQQSREASLLDQLHNAQQQQKDAVEMCKELKLQIQNAEEEHVLKEVNTSKNITRLTKEKNKFLSLSMERGTVIQEKQEEIQQLQTKLEEEKKARAEAEHRFEQEAEAVNADLKVKALQSAVDESMTKYNKLIMDFEAFKEHSANLLKQERELNKKLRYFTG